MPCKFVDEDTGECLHPYSNPGRCPYPFPDKCPYGEYKLKSETRMPSLGLYAVFVIAVALMLLFLCSGSLYGYSLSLFHSDNTIIQGFYGIIAWPIAIIIDLIISAVIVFIFAIIALAARNN